MISNQFEEWLTNLQSERGKSHLKNDVVKVSREEVAFGPISNQLNFDFVFHSVENYLVFNI